MNTWPCGTGNRIRAGSEVGTAFPVFLWLILKGGAEALTVSSSMPRSNQLSLDHAWVRREKKMWMQLQQYKQNPTKFEEN